MNGTALNRKMRLKNSYEENFQELTDGQDALQVKASPVSSGQIGYVAAHNYRIPSNSLTEYFALLKSIKSPFPVTAPAHLHRSCVG